MATATRKETRVPLWLGALVPIVAIAGVLAIFVALDPLSSFRTVPPAEAIAVERTVLDPGTIELSVRNDGPDPVTIAQVLVNDAYWPFQAGTGTLDRLETTTITLDYPWDEGLPLNIGMVTSTGLVIEHEIEAAALTPEPDSETFVTYALLGLFIGVIPVGIGLLWLPSLRRASQGAIRFFLAFTVGLLVFLFIDTVEEGFELAAAAPSAFNGLSVFLIGAIAAVGALLVLERSLEAKNERAEGSSMSAALVLAYLVAAGIGLHNLGEGLAVGAALATGEVALGTFLVLGFALHNTTEGLAIVAPIGAERARPALGHFFALCALAGGPAVIGAWLGGFAFAALWAALAFGVAAGAIAQVVWQIGKGMDGGRGLATAVGFAGLLAGLAVMYVTGLLTA